MADKSFIGLVHSVLSSAEASLGQTESPMLTRLVRDGALARRTAERSKELLEMLARKTFGNLDETERDVLHRAQVRVRDLLRASEEAEAEARAEADGDASGGGAPGPTLN